MRYEVRIIDAFTGHILHPDGSGRTQRAGDVGFHETFENRESALRRKDELLLRSGVTEVSIMSEDKADAHLFQNQALIDRIVAERNAAFKKRPIQPPQRNAGGRPPSGDLSASETPSSFGPRG
jgi:hypothetical protein